MKAKLGNVVVDFWIINPKESVEDYEPWLQEAHNKKLVGWSHEFSSVTRGGNSPGLFSDFFSKKIPDTKSSVLKEGLPEIYIVSGTPTRGNSGDYLVHNENSINKYTVVSKKNFEKQYKII